MIEQQSKQIEALAAELAAMKEQNELVAKK
jgi:hypothetical protein